MIMLTNTYEKNFAFQAFTYLPYGNITLGATLNEPAINYEISHWFELR